MAALLSKTGEMLHRRRFISPGPVPQPQWISQYARLANDSDSTCCALRFHSMPREAGDLTQPRGLLVSFRRVPSKPEGRRMGTKSRHRDRFCGALAAVCAAALPAVADAQNAAIDRIEAIEHKIRGLQSELQHLKSELGEAKR